MNRRAFQFSAALLISILVLLATALRSSAANGPGPALAPAQPGNACPLCPFPSRLQPVQQIATSSALPNAVAIIIGGAIDYSGNGGSTWSVIPAGPWPSDAAIRVALAPRGDPTAPVRVIVAAAGKIYRTGDYGQNWATVTLPLPSYVVDRTDCGSIGDLVVSPVDPNRLYAEYSYARYTGDGWTYFYCLYTSGNAGLTWQLVDDGIVNVLLHYGLLIFPSPVLAGRVYANYKRSDNAGATWTYSAVPPYQLALDANNPNFLNKLQDDYGINGTTQGWRSTDGGGTWSLWAQQICQRPSYQRPFDQLMAHPTLSNVLFARCYSGLWRSTNSGDHWEALSVASGELLAPDYGHPGRLLWARGDGLWASTDAGTHWTNLTPDYLAPVPGPWRSRTKPSSFAAECDSCDLLSVDALSQNNAWAVGEQGMIVHWNGSTWAKVSSPVTTTLNAVSMVSANDGWAVGEQGTILRWNGSTWAKVNSPVPGTLSSVDMVSPTDGWAVGWNHLLRWNGSTWTPMSVPAEVTGVSMWSVLMLSANDGWAVGYYDIPLITARLHWNGTEWTQINSSQCAWPYSLSAVSTNAVWAVGNFGEICRWDGNTWSAVWLPVSNDVLLSIAMVSANDGWVVGYSGRTLHWDGSTWTDLPKRPTNRGLLGMVMLDASHGWIVGENGIILDRYDRLIDMYLPSVSK